MHVKLALADMDLSNASALVKPALLYADRITIYSPAASLVSSVQELATITDPRAQALLVLELAQQVPTFRDELSVDDASLEQIKMLMSLDPRVLQAAGTATGHRAEIDDLLRQLDEIPDLWEQVPSAVAESIATVGGEDIMRAVDSGILTVADISDAGVASVVGSAVNAAIGDSTDESDYSGQLIAGWASHVVAMLNDPSAFPLLDGQSADLMQSLEREAGATAAERTARRGSEVGAAAQFMAVLPYFVDLPIDEVLSLREELQAPLVQFRGEMGQLSKDFTARQFDEGFEEEVNDAWRTRVAPALADVREGLAEHGLLREAASVVRGDFRRLAVEAGGVFVAAGSGALNLSRLMTIGVATGLPIADVVGRAFNARQQTRSTVRTNSFYFLHKLSEEAAARTGNR